MDTQHAQFPYSGLHVYQRAQEAWTLTQDSESEASLRGMLEAEVRRAVLGIARATAHVGRRDAFRVELERARGAIHAAGAIADQLARRGTPVDEELQEFLVDAARMLGALIRTLRATEGTEPVPGNQNGASVQAEA